MKKLNCIGGAQNCVLNNMNIVKVFEAMTDIIRHEV